jgi:Holliday junction resolvase RusA-like endonuclease
MSQREAELKKSVRTMSFVVPLKGQPQGSMSAFSRGSFTVVTSANKKLKPFRASVKQHATAAVNQYGIWWTWYEPVTCDLEFTFVRPKSVKESKRPHHVVKPDCDKLARGIFDALTGSVWADDAQCVYFTARKRYGATESVQITVSDYAPDLIQS